MEILLKYILTIFSFFIFVKNFCIYDAYYYTDIPLINSSEILSSILNDIGENKKIYVLFIYSSKNETCNNMTNTYNKVFKSFNGNAEIKIYRVYANSGMSNLITPREIPCVIIIYNGQILKGLNGDIDNSYILTGIQAHKDIVKFIYDAYKTAIGA